MSTGAAAITLDLNRIEELFQAPDADPFCSNETAILGQSGMDFLRKHSPHKWPRQRAAQQLLIRLPPTLPASSHVTTEQLTHTTRAAIEHYCQMQIQAIRDARRLKMAAAWRELLIALAVTIVAIALLVWCVNNDLSGVRGAVLGVATLLAVYAASLSIWDALESLFFDWGPFAVESIAYQWISGLEVQVVIEPPQA